MLGSGMMLPLVAGILASGTGQPRSPYIFMFVFLGLGMLLQGGMYLRSRTAKR